MLYCSAFFGAAVIGGCCWGGELLALKGGTTFKLGVAVPEAGARGGGSLVEGTDVGNVAAVFDSEGACEAGFWAAFGMMAVCGF